MQYTARQATLSDLGSIVCHRYLMFAEIGHGDPAVMEAGKAQYTEWLRARLLNGRYQGWLMETDSGEVVAGVGLWLLEWPGGVVDLVPFRGYVFNVWTEPAHRRNGLSRQLMGMLLEASKEQGIHRVYLHASDAGRKLYELLGFSPSNEMMVRLPMHDARASH